MSCGMRTGSSTLVPTPGARAAKSCTAARWRASQTCGSPRHGATFSTSRRDCQDAPRPPRLAKLRGVTRNNLDRLDVDIPLGVFTSVTGISGSGKSSLISQFLVEAVSDEIGQRSEPPRR